MVKPLVRAASEALGMQSIMSDLGWSCKIRLLVDSSAAKSIASRTGLGKLRHLEIKFLWLQECASRQSDGEQGSWRSEPCRRSH